MSITMSITEDNQTDKTKQAVMGLLKEADAVDREIHGKHDTFILTFADGDTATIDVERRGGDVYDMLFDAWQK